MLSILRIFREPIRPDIKKVFKVNFWYLPQISCLFPEVSGDWENITIFLMTLYMFCFILCIPLYSIAFVDLFSEMSVISKAVHLYLLIILGCFFLLSFMLSHRQSIIEFYQSVHNGFFNYGTWGVVQEDRVRTKYNARYWITLGIPTVFVILSGSLVPFASDIDELFGAQIIKGVRNGINYNLPMPIWYPFDTSHGLNYWLAFFLQFLIGAIVSLIIATVDVIFVNSLHHMCIQLEILTTSLEAIDERAMIYLESGIKESYELAYERCLQECIDHHSNINNNFVHIQNVANMPIFWAFNVGAIVIGMSGVDVLFGSTRVGTVILNSALCIAEVANMAMICWYGQEVYNMSENLHDTIYFTNWYKAPLKLVKLKRIMMERTIKPLLLTGGPWNANLDTLKAVLNTSFSYFNVVAAARN